MGLFNKLKSKKETTSTDSVVVKPVKNNNGITFTMPDDPSKDGYTFGGWFFDKNTWQLPLTTNSTLRKKATVYAKWIVVTYTIEYELNGGEAATNPEEYTIETAEITLKEPSKANRVFSGWYVDGSFTGEPITKITTGTTGNIKLYAKWKLATYKIQYGLNGGKVAGNPKEYTIETAEITLKEPLKDNHVFDGWYVDSSFTGEPVTKIATGSTGDIKLYAKWIEGTDGLVYEYYDAKDGASGEASVKDYYGLSKNIVIPSSVNGHKVTSIRDSAFYSGFGEYKAITSVTIPSSVTTIESQAFFGCDNLRSVTIPSSVTTIESYAFSCCDGLTTLTIPSSVTSIGNSAFEACSELTTVTISNGVTSIGQSAFKYCLGLETITIPSSVISIGDEAFQHCEKLTTVTILNGVKKIGNSTFSFCKSLKNVVIPDSVTSMGDSVFSRCHSLKNVIIPDSVTSIEDAAFSDCYSLITVTIPSSVTSIGNSAFHNCVNLVDVTIPSSVTKIDDYAFYSCRKLIEIYYLSKVPLKTDSTGQVVVGDHIKYVHTSLEEKSQLITTADNYVFALLDNQYCLLRYAGEDTDLVLPDNINGKSYSIYQYAFSFCNSLKSVTIPNGVTSIGVGAFYNCKSLTSATIPSSVTSIGNSAFYNCDSLTAVTISDGVTTIEKSAFENCKSLKSVTIPNSVTSIGESAFEDCNSLARISISNSVVSIENKTFSCCTNLTTVTIPNSVTSIGNEAFSYCDRLIEVYNLSTLSITAGSDAHGEVGYNAKNIYTSLEEKSQLITTADGYIFVLLDNNYYLLNYVGEDADLVLPDNVDGKSYSLYQSAFYNCKWITSVTIPNSITNIENQAFLCCRSLKSISLPNSVKRIGVQAFASCESLKSVNIPNSVTCIEGSAFSHCTSLTNITIPNSVKSVGRDAFESCYSLADVILSSSLKRIEVMSFSRCHSLTSVTIPNGVKTIGEGAFNDCKCLASVVIPSSIKEIEDDAFSECFNLLEVYNLSYLDIEEGSTEHGEVGHYAKYIHSSLDVKSKVIPTINRDKTI